MAELEKRIREYLGSLSFPPRHEEVLKDIKSVLATLTEAGVLALGDDKDLTGDSLEIRTKLLFQRLRFKVEKGRPGQEDLVVKPPSDGKIKEALVVEVKSSKQPNVTREDLRQLDDWVFELSGEEKARNEGLGGGFDPAAMMTRGLMSTRRRHPTPHKGILVFNGPVGMDFDSRREVCFNENDRQFIEKRNFCIAPLGVLVQYEKPFESDESVSLLLWERLHTTTGMLSRPTA